MDATYAVVAVAAFLLCVAGIEKVRRPGSAVAAMRVVGLPSSTALVRGGAAVECAIGVWAIVEGTAWPRALVAASFLAFAAFLAAARRSPRAEGCGCFGAGGVPPGLRQVTLDAALGGVAAASLAASPQSAIFLLVHSPLVGSAFTACALVGAVLAYSFHETPRVETRT